MRKGMSMDRNAMKYALLLEMDEPDALSNLLAASVRAADKLRGEHIGLTGAEKQLREAIAIAMPGVKPCNKCAKYGDTDYGHHYEATPELDSHDPRPNRGSPVDE